GHAGQRRVLRHERRAVPGRRVRLHLPARARCLRGAFGLRRAGRLLGRRGCGRRPAAPDAVDGGRAQGLCARPARLRQRQLRSRRARRGADGRRLGGLSMPVTVKVNGTTNSLVHKGSNGISTATIPDVCKTPSPAGPVPIPYPNISQSSTLDKGTSTVKADGMMIAIKGSEFSLSNGDNAGVAGGVKSSTFMKESTWILYSFDVKLDGQNACRLSDKKFQNHENTADLAGVLQPPVVVTPKQTDEDKCPCCNGPLHDNQKDDSGKPLKKTSQDAYYQGKKDAVDQKIAGFEPWAAANPAKATEVITLKFGAPIFPHVTGPRDML